MLHPDSQLRMVNHKKGRGIFATAPIPKGTATYIKDELEIEIHPDDRRLYDPRYKNLIETYTYIDENGIRVLSWDQAKYINHCCNCNTMSTGYGFEIALRDILPGEEITDEYGLFNFNHTMNLFCDKEECRGVVSGKDVDRYYEEWDENIKAALQNFNKVEQPLLQYMDDSTKQQLETYLKTGTGYKSVLQLRYCLKRNELP